MKKKLFAVALTAFGVLGTVAGASAACPRGYRFFSSSQPGFQGETCTKQRNGSYLHKATYRTKRYKQNWVVDKRYKDSRGRWVTTYKLGPKVAYWAEYSCTATHN